MESVPLFAHVGKKKQKRLTGEEREGIVQDYLAGKSSVQLAFQHEVHTRTIFRTLQRQGVKIRTNTKNNRLAFPLREDAFDNALADEEASYWVGFLAADGNISGATGESKVQIALKEADAGHLEKLRTFLGSRHKIGHYLSSPNPLGRRFPLAKLVVTSDRLVKSLARFGVCKKKSLIVEAKDGMDQSVWFWRGVIDGDGTIVLSKKSNGLYANLRLCGSKRLMEQFIDFVGQRIGTRAKPHLRSGIWQVSLDCTPGMEAVRLFYADAKIALCRKWAVAVRILAGCNQSGKLVTSP